MNAEARIELSRALVVTGFVLYVPANVLPVMTMSVTGDVQPLTVLGGVQELYDSGLAPVAGVVFVASILIPFVKLVCLAWILLLHGSTRWMRARTAMLAVLRQIGTWSMIDIFLLAVLVAVGQLGAIASVTAQPGCLFFAAVLLSTLFAAECYRPQFIWTPSALKSPA